MAEKSEHFFPEYFSYVFVFAIVFLDALYLSCQIKSIFLKSTFLVAETKCCDLLFVSISVFKKKIGKALAKAILLFLENYIFALSFIIAFNIMQTSF